MAEQSAILDAAAAYVKPGGRLVYITCSVFSDENSGQVAGFVARSPEFQPVDHDALWAEHFPGHGQAARVDKAAGIVADPGTQRHRRLLLRGSQKAGLSLDYADRRFRYAGIVMQRWEHSCRAVQR